MEFKLFKIKGSWKEIKDSCRTTINLESGTQEPTDEWKKRILMSEHSPIRQLSIKGKWYNLPYWVSTHFVRHWLGIVHWVGTQRTDRRKDGVNRGDQPQNTPVVHEIEANAQALINISRKRLCHGASPETQKAWGMVKAQVAKEDPILASVMTKECIYRGFCPEFCCCGYVNTDAYKKELAEYRSGINGH